MTAIPVTLLYGGLSTLLLVALGSIVSLRRVAFGPTARMGLPNPEPLLHIIRAHGNAAEWIPIGIVALLLLELSRAPSFWLHVCGGAFLVLRLLHAAYALFRLPFALSFVVGVANNTLVGGMAGWVLWLRFAAHA